MSATQRVHRCCYHGAKDFSKTLGIGTARTAPVVQSGDGEEVISCVGGSYGGIEAGGCAGQQEAHYLVRWSDERKKNKSSLVTLTYLP